MANLDLEKNADHLLISDASAPGAVLVLWNMFTTPTGVEKIFVAATNQWYDTSYLVGLFAGQTSSTFGLADDQKPMIEGSSIACVGVSDSPEQISLTGQNPDMFLA